MVSGSLLECEEVQCWIEEVTEYVFLKDCFSCSVHPVKNCNAKMSKDKAVVCSVKIETKCYFYPADVKTLQDDKRKNKGILEHLALVFVWFCVCVSCVVFVSLWQYVF